MTLSRGLGVFDEAVITGEVFEEFVCDRRAASQVEILGVLEEAHLAQIDQRFVRDLHALC